ncbi:hypothetical protein GEMRC1_007591 [Eukaryota sp. GEM-RC1]
MSVSLSVRQSAQTVIYHFNVNEICDLGSAGFISTLKEVPSILVVGFALAPSLSLPRKCTRIVVLDISTGEVVWIQDFRGTVNCAQIMVGGALLLGFADGKLLMM